MFRRKRIILWVPVLLAGWVLTDLFFPFKSDISRINAEQTAQMDGAMWRSYYEKRKFKLFLESSKLMRQEFHFPLWRSFRAAYYTAKAAFAFKDAHSRADYEKALPWLKKYYGLVNNISIVSFDTDSAANAELEWWIIRRDREHHPPSEWENWLATTAAIIYHIPASSFNQYAQLRVQAMLIRDEKGNSITEEDWQRINHILLEAWKSFAMALKQKNKM